MPSGSSLTLRSSLRLYEDQSETFHIKSKVCHKCNIPSLAHLKNISLCMWHLTIWDRQYCLLLCYCEMMWFFSICISILKTKHCFIISFLLVWKKNWLTEMVNHSNKFNVRFRSQYGFNVILNEAFFARDCTALKIENHSFQRSQNILMYKMYVSILLGVSQNSNYATKYLISGKLSCSYNSIWRYDSMRLFLIWIFSSWSESC